MKKIIIIFSIIFMTFSQSYAEVTFSGTWNLVENKILELKNKKLEEKIFDLDNISSDLNRENSILKQKIETLTDERDKFNIEKSNLQKEIKNNLEKKLWVEDLLKEIYNQTIWDFQYSMTNQSDQEKFISYALIYLSISLFLFVFFYIFTIPLRILRWIWRFFSWYKPCSDEKTKTEFNKLIKRYKNSVEQVKKLSDENSSLVYENWNLKNKNSKLKEKNYKLNLEKQEKITSNVREKIKSNKLNKEKLNLEKDKKEEEIFIFQDESSNSSLDLINNSKSTLFDKKEKKFDLNSEKNKKSKLFD